MKFIKLILLIICASMQPLHALNNSAPNPDLPGLGSLTGLPPELCDIITDKLDDLGDLIKYQLLKPEPNWSPASISSSVSGDYLAVSLRHKVKNLHKVLLFKVNVKTAQWELYKAYDGGCCATLSPNGKHIALLYQESHIAAIENINGGAITTIQTSKWNAIFKWSTDSKQLIGDFDGYRYLWKEEKDWHSEEKDWHSKVEQASYFLKPIFLSNKLFFIHSKFEFETTEQYNRSLDMINIFLVSGDQNDEPNFNNKTHLWRGICCEAPFSTINSTTLAMCASEAITIYDGIHRKQTSLAKRENGENRDNIFDREYYGRTRWMNELLGVYPKLSPENNFLALKVRTPEYDSSYECVHFIEIYRHNISKNNFEYVSSIKLEENIKEFYWLADGKGLVLVTGDNEIEIFVTQGKTLQLKNDRMTFLDRYRSQLKKVAMIIGGLAACGLIYYLWKKFSWDDVVGKTATPSHTYSPGYPAVTSTFKKLFSTSNPQ